MVPKGTAKPAFSYNKNEIILGIFFCIAALQCAAFGRWYFVFRFKVIFVETKMSKVCVRL